MATEGNHPPVLAADQPPKRRGCFFYGCIISLCLFVLVVAGVVSIGVYVVKWANRMIEEYTDTSPMTLPHVQVSQAELDKLKARLTTFSDGMDNPSNAPLVLTGEEVNVLLQNSDAVTNAGLNDKFYVSLDGDKFNAKISLPLDKFPQVPFIHTKGRWLNGSGTFTAGVTNGELSVYIQSLEAKGKPLPERFISRLQERNLAENVNENPTNTATMSRFESIVITNGTLVIKSKPK